MNTSIEIVKNINNLDTVYVHGARVSSLVRYLNPNVPYVWILDHGPYESSVWNKVTLPLNGHESITTLSRRIVYDLMLDTADFINKSASFDTFGLFLIQAFKPMPDTLRLHTLPVDRRDAILIANGAFLQINLPHAGETAQVVCFESGYLESLQ